MSMYDTTHPGDVLYEAAARWHVRLRDEPDSAEVQHGLRAWLEADIEHRLAYAEVCAAGFAVEQVLHVSAPAVAGQGDSVFGGPPRPLRQPATVASRRRRRALAAVALAASVVLAVLAPWMWLHLQSDHVGQPGLVQQHVLEDGSVLRLDGASAVRVRYADDGRRVDVLRGAVHVDVRPDPARPFVVHSGDLTARALGTRYAVADAAGRRSVVVDAGRVAVRLGAGETMELHAGDRLSVDAESGQAERTAAGPGDAAWLTGQLVFSATPFDEAVAAMARHLPERVVISRSLPAEPVTAVAPVAEARQLLQRLGSERGYRSTRVPGLLIVLH